MPTPKQMLIIQHLVSSPTHNKNASFLTKEQAQERLDKMRETYGHGCRCTGLYINRYFKGVNHA